MMWDKTITVFNKRFDKATRSDKYYRGIINGCFLDDIKQVSTSKNGPDNADSVFITIPFDNVPNYLEPKEYESKVDYSKYLTLKDGDIIVKGKVVEDYQTLKDIQLRYDYVYTITKVDKKDFGSMPHFEIGGK